MREWSDQELVSVYLAWENIVVTTVFANDKSGYKHATQYLDRLQAEMDKRGLSVPVN